MVRRSFAARATLSLAALAALTLAAGCAGGLKKSLEPSMVDRSYKITGTRWKGISSGVTAVAVKAYESEGFTALCAAWGDSDAGLRDVSAQYVGTAKLYLAGDAIANGFAFARPAGVVSDLQGVPTNCVETSVPWKAAYANATPDLKSPRRFYGF